MSDPTDLDAIKARLAKIEWYGPWRVSRDAEEGSVVLDPWGNLAASVEVDNDDRGTAEFIAHAREDVPALLAEVERLRHERDETDRRNAAFDEHDAQLITKLREERDLLRTALTAVVDAYFAWEGDHDVLGMRALDAAAGKGRALLAVAEYLPTEANPPASRWGDDENHPTVAERLADKLGEANE